MEDSPRQSARAHSRQPRRYRGGIPAAQAKAFLACDRNVTRDYLDFAALSGCATPEEVLASLLKLDARYGELQTASVALEVAKALCAAAPFDLNESELPLYKGIAEKWHRWETTRGICSRFGVLLGEALVREGN